MITIPKTWNRFHRISNSLNIWNLWNLTCSTLTIHEHVPNTIFEILVTSK